jgi:hypothetical protein
MKLLWIPTTVVAVLVVITGGYLFWQYRCAQPPSLDSLPTHPSPVPTADIPGSQRDEAEARLRDLASSAQSGYRVVGEQFCATDAKFIWDALRLRVGPTLESAGYAAQRNGWTSDYRIAYSLYGPDGTLRRCLNDDLVLIAGLVKPTNRTATGRLVHLYGYFHLSPT